MNLRNSLPALLRAGAVVLSLGLAWSPLARSQNPDSQSATNQIANADDQTDTTAADETDTTTEAAGTATTNTVAAAPSVPRTTATEQPSGRESRSRRLRNRRANPSENAAGSPTAANAAATNGPAALEYPAFKVVADRNIFNPNRRHNEPGSRSRSRTPRVDSFSLVGTMTYEKGSFAFFNGTSSEYQKALQCSGQIAGYKIAAVTPNSVKLVQDTNEIELRVGHQLRREDEGPWTLSTASTTFGGSPAPSRRPGGSEPPPSVAPPSGPQSEILQRLMSRREKE